MRPPHKTNENISFKQLVFLRSLRITNLTYFDLHKQNKLHGKIILGTKLQRKLITPLAHWDRGFESHSVFIDSVFVLSCIGCGLAMGCSPVQGVILTLKIEISEWKETRPNVTRKNNFRVTY